MNGNNSENHQSFIHIWPLTNCKAPHPWTVGVYALLLENVGCGPHHHGWLLCNPVKVGIVGSSHANTPAKNNQILY